MIQNQYYYLVAGLPELFLEADNRKMDFVGIRGWLRANLEGSDIELLDALSLHYDNENILSYIGNRGVYNNRGTIPSTAYDDIQEYSAQFPSYISDFLSSLNRKVDEEEEVVDEEEEKSKKIIEADLLERYYRFVGSYRNEFLQKWFSFDRQLRNILAAFNARKLGKEVYPYLVGDDPINEILSHSLAPDFGLRGDFPLMDKLMPVIEIPNIFEREKKIDMLRWDFIDEANTYDYFNVDRVIGYLLKAEIIDRWIKLDPAVGEELLKRYFSDLKGTFDLNAAFEEQ